jgi:hypothetical protein
MNYALLQVVRNEPGQAFTAALPGTSVDRLSQFNRGGLLFEDAYRSVSLTVSLRDYQLRLLRDTAASTGGVCIVDDFNPRWSERDTAALGPTAFGVDEEVYHRIDADVDDDEFAIILSNGNTFWHGVAAVCSMKPTINASRTSTASELARCAASVRLITCIAYDGEGFVAWRRTRF